ncbi:hypothetical protein [Singulisphaera sp. GP187]|uniref:hypothetical protein n=1 Tax=Singulisphaera sp. GP187 TaxID=1882752 RepID=UPI0020B119DE|nr:hypothetical protein [Singulisphaera sp. GP187]
MLAAFQGLSWLQRWKGKPDMRSARTRPRRHRARFRVESLEPRWLLSTTAGGEAESRTSWGYVDISDGYGLIMQDMSRSDDSGVVALSSMVTLQFPIAASDDWSTAHLVPNAMYVQVNGNPNLGSGPDLLELHAAQGYTEFGFSLKSTLDNQPVAEDLQVLDANHNGLVKYSTSPTTQVIEFTITVRSWTASSVFLKIGLPAGMDRLSGQADNSFPYLLEITRVWRPSYAAPCGTPGSTVPQEVSPYASYPPSNAITIPPSTLGPPSTPNPPTPPGPGKDTSPGGPEYYADLPLPYGPTPSVPKGPIGEGGAGTISLPVPVGPLPVRSTAPLGGALAAPDSVPAVNRHEPARADLAEFDPDRALEDVDFNPRQVVPAAEPEPAPVITLRGPGGLPLLATALIAGSAVSVRTDSDPKAAQGGAESVEAAVATGPVVTQVQASSLSAEPTASASSSRTPTESSGRASKRSHRSSVVPGLTLAFALGIGLVLPDLVASLQFHAPTRPLLRLRMIRRAFKGQ